MQQVISLSQDLVFLSSISKTNEALIWLYYQIQTIEIPQFGQHILLIPGYLSVKTRA